MNEAPAPPSRNLRDFLSPFELPLIIAAAHLAAFSLARLAVLVFHADEFSALRGGEVVLALFRGLRFDAAAIFPVIGLPLFFLMLPIPGPRASLWRKGWGWICYAAFA